jgi:hypothetical protein
MEADKVLSEKLLLRLESCTLSAGRLFGQSTKLESLSNSAKRN